MTTCKVPDNLLHNSTNSRPCYKYDEINQAYFAFDSQQLAKVIITWVLFVLSVTGNIFVLVSLRSDKKTSNIIVMFNVAVADLVYACSVLPLDAIWNMTMQWYGGDVLCRGSQMFKQFGMYCSAYMIMVIGIDRAWTIRKSPNPRWTGPAKLLTRIAWVISCICCIPAGIFFSTCKVDTCEGIEFTQCVDNISVPEKYLQPYHIYTMFMSFILPFISTIVTCSIIISVLLSMKKREQPSSKTNCHNELEKAICAQAKFKTLVTITFLICWGPYYCVGILSWLGYDVYSEETPLFAQSLPYMVMYLNCFLHPIVFGVQVKRVRRNFLACIKYPLRRRISSTTCSTQFNTRTTKHMVDVAPVSLEKHSTSKEDTELLSNGQSV